MTTDTKPKHTPGTWKAHHIPETVVEDGVVKPTEGMKRVVHAQRHDELGRRVTQFVAEVFEQAAHPEQGEVNAQLIAEAGTVATETGLTPRQLAEQRQELLQALEECAGDLESEIKARASGELPRRIERDMEAVTRARAAIAKAKGSEGA